MDAVPVVYVYAVVDIPKDEDGAGRGVLPGRDYGVHPMRRGLHIMVVFHILQKVQAEFVETQIHDGDAAGHLLDVHDFLLKPL